MANNIVQHRRGTREDWLALDLVPEDGELVIEEYADGTCRCKIGNGISKFSALPYLDEETVQKLAEVERDVANIETAVASLVKPSIDVLDAKYSGRLTAIESVHASDVSDLRNLVETSIAELSLELDNKLCDTKDELEDSIASEAKALETDYASKIAKAKREVTDQLSKQYQEQINSLNTADIQLKSDVENKHAELLAELEKLSNNVRVLEGKLSPTGTQSGEPVSVTAQIASIQNKLLQLAGDDSLLLSKVYALSATVGKINDAVEAQAARHKTDKASMSADIKTVLDRLSSVDSAVIEELGKNVDDLYSYIEKLSADDLTLFNKITKVESKLSSDIFTLKTDTTRAINEAKTNLRDDIDDTRIALSEEITANKTDLRKSLGAVKSELSTAINVTNNEILHQGEQIAALAGDLTRAEEALNNTITDIQTQVDATNAQVDSNRLATDASFEKVADEINLVNETVTSLRTDLAVQVDRISKIVALEDGSTTGDAELADARTSADKVEYSSVGDHIRAIGEEVRDARINEHASLKDTLHALDSELTGIRSGYDGKKHSTAAKAVQAIGQDLAALKNSLPDYIPDNSVDGLAYQDNELYLTSGGKKVGASVKITGGGGGSGSSQSSSITMLPVGKLSQIFAQGVTAEIKFTYNSVFGGVSTGDGACTLEIGGKRINLDQPVLNTADDPNAVNTINITEYLSTESREIFVICSDMYGTTSQLRFIAKLAELKVETDFKLATVFSDRIVFPYRVFGENMEKQLNILVDDEVFVDNEQIAFTGASEFILTKAEYVNSGCTKPWHGVHTIELFLNAARIGNSDVDNIKSNKLIYKMLCVEAGDNTPIIAIASNANKAVLGDRLQIPFIIYHPNGPQDCIVSRKIYEQTNGGAVVSRTPSDIIAVNGSECLWDTRDYDTGELIFEVFYKYVDSFNTEKIVSDTHTISVESPNTGGSTVEDVTVVKDSLALELTAAGRANSELLGEVDENNVAYTGRNSWTFTPSGSTTTIATEFTDFNWASNGWMTDSAAGEQYLRVSGGATVTIQHKPFTTNIVHPAGNGWTFEADFAVRNAAKSDALVLSCANAGGEGLTIGADTATFKLGGTSVSCKYKEDERLHLAIIVNSDTPAGTPLVEGSEARFMYMYLNGVLSSVAKYNHEATIGNNNNAIVLGSSDALLDIYSIRIYNRSLNMNEALNNYIASIVDRTTRYKLIGENAITLNGKISYNAVRAKAALPIVTFTGKMPSFKGDSQTVKMRFEDPDRGIDKTVSVKIDVQGTSSAAYARKNWKIKLSNPEEFIPGMSAKVFCLKVDYAEATGTHNTGTANFVEALYDKETYPLPPQRDTLDADGLTVAGNSEIRSAVKGFPCVIFEKETDSSEPIFASKANFNFDKGAENVFGFSDDFDTECWEFCNNDKAPCTFVSELDPEDWVSCFEPRYSQATYVDDKGEAQSAWDRIEELADKRKLAAAGKGSMSDAELAEFAELSRSTIARFKQMHDWVVSTATYDLIFDGDGNVIGTTPLLAKPFEKPAVGEISDVQDTIDGIDYSYYIVDGRKCYVDNSDVEPKYFYLYNNKKYYEDDEACRLAKFKAEFNDYFNMHYSVIYYVFTFFALMADQRAKNMFLTYWHDFDEDGNQLSTGKWYPYFYDNDTIFGVENAGSIRYDYYHEDHGEHGVVNGKNVYSGQHSVLWNNFRECFWPEIAKCYHELRANKLEYNSFLRNYLDYGAGKWNAAIYNADAYYKYIELAIPHYVEVDGKRTLVEDTTYLPNVRGTGEHRLKRFLYNRFKYCDGMWQYVNTAQNRIYLRLNVGDGSSPDIKIKAASPSYSSVKYGGASPIKETVRLNAGDVHTFTSGGLTNGEVETYVWFASEIAELPDMSNLYVQVADLKDATKLKVLVIGSNDYANGNLKNLDVGGLKLLETVDVRNCNNSEFTSLGLNSCENIKNVNTEGTHINEVTLPNGGNVQSLILSDKTSNLTIKNQNNIKVFYILNPGSVVGDYKPTGIEIDNSYFGNIAKLVIEGGNLDSLAILRRCLEDSDKFTVCLTDFDWDFRNYDGLDGTQFLIDLAENKNITGISPNQINQEKAYLKGTCFVDTIDGTDMAKLTEYYKKDLIVNFNTMNVNLAFNYDSTSDGTVSKSYEVEVLGKDNGGNADSTGTFNVPAFDNIRVPTNDAFTYTFAGWSTGRIDYPDNATIHGWSLEDIEAHEAQFSNPTAFEDIITGIAGDMQLYPVFSATRKTFTVEYVNKYGLTGAETVRREVVYGDAAPSIDNAVHRDAENFEFIEWRVATEGANLDYVTCNITCYATFDIIESERVTLATDDFNYTSHDQKAGTIAIANISNKLNEIIRVPKTVTVNGFTYTITKLGGFNDYHQLLSVELPDSIKTLSSRAFAGCQNLVDITLPDTITTIEATCFNNCYSLSDIVLPVNLTKIYSYTFSGTALETIEMPRNITSIGDHAFGDLSRLRTVTFKKRLTTNQETGVSEVYVPSIANKPGYSAFSGYIGTGIVEIRVPWSYEQHQTEFAAKVNGVPGEGDPTFGLGNKVVFTFDYSEEVDN